MNTENYTSKITFSSRDLSPLEQVKYRDLSNTAALDKELADPANNGRLTLTPSLIFNVDVHNPKSKNSNDYSCTVIEDSETGVRYRTSSESFRSALAEILDGLKEVGIDPHTVPLAIYTVASKNYQGKNFITVSIA